MEIGPDWVNAVGAILGGIGSSIAAVLAWLATRQANNAANESNQTANQLLSHFVALKCTALDLLLICLGNQFLVAVALTY